ncbi:MAG: NADPH-dependent F420 reductase [Acidimicrobiales bacterium]|jgi:NADPH-dependent F420 reductase
MDVGILGGTGPAGKALAVRLASIGMSVSIGSRSAERGEETAAQLRDKWSGRDLNLRGASNEVACAAELVVVATPWEGAPQTVGALAPHLDGKVVVSMANALFKVGDDMEAVVPARGSLCVAVQGAAPQALVSGAFHHLPARGLANIDEPLDADVLVCSDHPAATKATIELVDRIPGCRGIDAGTLSAAAAIEAFTAVLIGVNIRTRSHASIRLTGLRTEAP